MISYVTLGTNDLPKAKQFYTALFALMGVAQMFESDRAVFFGRSPTEPLLSICMPYNKETATYGNGTMIAFTTASKEQVDQIYAKALELGGTSEGAPGFRIPDVLYIGYVRDLDGNKLAFTYRVA